MTGTPTADLVRVTDETLANMERNPSCFAAWVLRAVVRELMECRAFHNDRPAP